MFPTALTVVSSVLVIVSILYAIVDVLAFEYPNGNRGRKLTGLAFAVLGLAYIVPTVLEFPTAISYLYNAAQADDTVTLQSTYIPAIKSMGFAGIVIVLTYLNARRSDKIAGRDLRPSGLIFAVIAGVVAASFLGGVLLYQASQSESVGPLLIPSKDAALVGSFGIFLLSLCAVYGTVHSFLIESPSRWFIAASLVGYYMLFTITPPPPVKSVIEGKSITLSDGMRTVLLGISILGSFMTSTSHQARVKMRNARNPQDPPRSG